MTREQRLVQRIIADPFLKDFPCILVHDSIQMRVPVELQDKVNQRVRELAEEVGKA